MKKFLSSIRYYRLIYLICLCLYFCLGSMHNAYADKDEARRITIDDKTFRAVEVNPKRLRLFWLDEEKQPYRHFSGLKNALKKAGYTARVMMNAGIYTTKDTPAGLHIEQGQVVNPLNTRHGKGNFHIQPNGVFYVTADKQAAIRTTTAFAKKYGKAPASLFLAVQSGPMLVINGKINAQFTPEKKSQYSRNGVCVTRDKRVWFLVTANFVRSNLYQFALAAKQLGCNNALYLDGNLSKLYLRGQDSIFHFSYFVGILAEVDEKE